ncbi:hypothetical protein OH76DRAFT_1002467 [Lentinus brumalis]|uniref:Uncharacterized protein n=1 Tax=Lentinus brumalis TaxID=2498619 RepID=A0A371DQK7_9APHY|nr:hypothetical protein OH76DRAFT_1002467 [Polyporus brumalis]
MPECGVRRSSSSCTGYSPPMVQKFVLSAGLASAFRRRSSIGAEPEVDDQTSMRQSAKLMNSRALYAHALPPLHGSIHYGATVHPSRRSCNRPATPTRSRRVPCVSREAWGRRTCANDRCRVMPPSGPSFPHQRHGHSTRITTAQRHQSFADITKADPMTGRRQLSARAQSGGRTYSME